LAPATPAIPIITTTYHHTHPAPVFDADHWAANLRNPVRFSQAVATAGADHDTFIEISPHPLLTHAITDTLADTHHHSVATLQRDADETLTFHLNLNATHTTRPPQTPHPPEPHPTIPTTPWHHTHHWISTPPTIPDAHPTKPVQLIANSHPGTDDAIPSDWFYEPTWPVRPLPSADSAAGGSWLLLAHADVGVETGRILGGDSRVTVLAPSVLVEDGDRTALLDALSGTNNVLYAPAVPSTHFDVASAYCLFNAARRLAAALVALASPPRLFILTRNAQPVSEGDRANPTHAVLWGLGRTLALEHPEIWGGIIDLDDSVPAELSAQYVVAEARAADGEDQVVYRAGVRHVPRLERRSPASTSAGVLDGTASQLVIGATGNIGPHLIRQLADMGAATIVAVSRNPGSRLEELAQTLSTRGTKLIEVAADAADEGAMKALFDRFGTDLPPLEGIYLAARSGDPATIDEMTDDDVTTMFRPKLDALSLLHRLSLKTPVRQFVLFSSIAGLLGSRWLGHYAATSTFLDTFAYARRTVGLSATVVNWGLWKSLDDVQSDVQRQVSVETGLEPMPDELAIRALWSAMGPNAPVRSTVIAADWTRLATAYRTRGSLRIVDDLLLSDDATAPLPGGEFREALRACQPERRRDLLVDHVAAEAAAVMGLASSQSLDPSAGFFQLGMDSLMSVTLQRALSESLGEVLPASVVFDYPTVETLADYLATILPELIELADQKIVDAYADLTEAELLQRLSERLS
jgi:phthiocerol/phenolphthiocerol synthesis type-I polyketide synthase B